MDNFFKLFDKTGHKTFAYYPILPRSKKNRAFFILCTQSYQNDPWDCFVDFGDGSRKTFIGDIQGRWSQKKFLHVVNTRINFLLKRLIITKVFND